MTSRQIIIVIASIVGAVAVSAVLAGAFVKMKKENEKVTPPPIVRKVDSRIVEYANLPAEVSGTGRVISQQSVDVISEVQGKLMEGTIPLKKGNSFKQGDLLVKVYNQDAFYNLQSRKSGFLNALANILPDLKIDYPDSYPLWIDFFESITINNDLPNLPQINSNQEKIFLSSRNILSEYFAIKAEEVRLRKYNIYAPYNGSIREVMLEVGSVANPGSRIANIIRTDELEIEVPLEAAYAKWIGLGDKVRLYADDGTELGRGKVIREAAYVDASTQSINVYIAVTQSNSPLFAGQYAKVLFSGMVVKNSIKIPRKAVFNRNHVFIVDSGFLSMRQVEVLKVSADSVFISGLEEGVELVTEPLANMNENTRVQSEYTKPPVVDTTSVEVKGIDDEETASAE